MYGAAERVELGAKSLVGAVEICDSLIRRGEIGGLFWLIAIIDVGLKVFGGHGERRTKDEGRRTKDRKLLVENHCNALRCSELVI